MTNPNSQIESFPSEGRQFFTPVSVGILVQLFCAGLVMAVTAAISLSSSPGSFPTASNETSTDASDASSASTSPDNSSNASNPITSTEPTAENSTENSAAASNASTASTTPDAGHAAEMTANSSPAPPLDAATGSTTSSSTSPPVTNVRALDDVRQKSRKLPLAGEGLSDEIDLCKIFAQDPATVTLQLIGGEFTVPEQMTLTLKPFPVDAKSFLWKVSQESTSGLARNQEIGEFILKEQQLSFRWFRNMDKGKLPFCRLKISVGPDSEICDL